MTTRLLTGIDHLDLAIPDLSTGLALWERLGFELTPASSVDSRQIAFRSDYLALSSKFEPCGRIAWAATEAAAVAPCITGLPSFVCVPQQHRASQHPNGAIGLMGLTILVENAPDLENGLSDLFGIGAVVRTDDVVTVHVGRQTVLFADIDNASVLHPELDPDSWPQAPYLLVVSLATAHIAATSRYLAKANAAFKWQGQDGLLVLPDQDRDVALEFSAVKL